MCIVYPCMQNTEEIIAKYAVNANMFGQGSSILKHAGSGGTTPVRVWGAKLP